MQPQTAAFIEAYCQLLSAQFAEDAGGPEPSNLAFHHAVGRWHHRSRVQAWAAANNLNDVLHLGDKENPKFMLRDHVLTSGVGTLNGDLVILTANPGHAGNPTNDGEVPLRADEDGNIQFGMNFFSAFPNGIIGGWKHGWWGRVFQAARRFVEPHWNGQHSPEERWHWAQNYDGGIGCIDLFPFHSTGDKLSVHAMRRRQPNDAQLALRRIAETTLDMAIRARPKAILIASRVGARIVSDRPWQLHGSVEVEGRDLKMYVVESTPVFVYAVQLFSAQVRFVSDETRRAVADAMRGLVAALR